MPEYKLEYNSLSVRVYKKFRKLNPDSRLAPKYWSSIIKTFNELFAEYLLQTGQREKLPSGLGSFAISKKKTIRIIKTGYEKHIGLPVDWKRTREVGKKIYILNSHSDGFRAKWKWFREDGNIRMAELWMFKAVRRRSHDITRYIMDQDGQYLDKWRQWERKR